MKQSEIVPGVKFTNLTAIKRRPDLDRKPHYSWELLCDCGRTHAATANNLVRGIVHACPSCAARKRTAHRVKPHRKHRVRNIYFTMIARCHNEKSNSYQRYGGAGITVCSRWRESLDNFISDMGLPEDGQSIDRIDPSKGYEPPNCRWVDGITQANNKKRTKLYSMNGKSQSLSQWCRELGLSYDRVKARIKTYGMPFEVAITNGKLNKKYQYKTPDGVFNSLHEVAAHYGMSVSGVSSRFKSESVPEWTKL